ncbi:S-methyl-5-thioribose-1-phosphate isomerase [Xenorhabdus sp. PR6a]|uniref:S-methyl-5-thioribose-1-phosphate isomerase n=1 Tax=Xenorhabdus sp. PR6a TaxID=3025877 RepID=UPI0023591691|nr:S-methyl-5-thioribose-1-phosphate isomerase [Xenorhabdus sp. PR6a]MDC9583187.1 S-methyl-5-thioribose-1-phosphate isomerase [Xenorhabdus sp. PR6a]
MKISGTHYRSVWLADDGYTVEILDQTKLPFEVQIIQLRTLQDAATAIKEMWVRGAPLIGAVAAYGMALAMHQENSDENLRQAYAILVKTRPTAINLKWALDRTYQVLENSEHSQREATAYRIANEIADEDVELCRKIGEHGLQMIQCIAATKPSDETVNILTHCNAGWLATVDWGTALAPIYMAHDAGIKVHVWVDETRPRNQGGLTAFELGSHGVSHTLIADNAGGHLMQHGKVDLCLVGTDRTTARGDVCNKIGTYLKALAAKANQVPFYVALPSPTLDFTVWDGVKEIPIEQRSGKEQSHTYGITPEGIRSWVNTVPPGTSCGNYAFDVTPAELITGLITERGICDASAEGLQTLFPDLCGQP